ncbi:MAG TPA: ABC transporter permease [Anaerolineales bacterium]|nr:ABC transporter permease [Anaerolineales bacterium]
MSAPPRTGLLGAWQLRRRAEVPVWLDLLARLVAIVMALLLVGIVLKLTGLDPLALGRKAVGQTLGSAYGLQQALILATPLAMTGLAVALGMRMRLWNIGAEGQLYLGAFFATALALFVEGPPALMLAGMIFAGALGGAAWVLLPALMRAYWNINEIITTLLLNFVSVLLVTHFAIGPWRDTGASILSATRRLPYEMPALGNSYLTAGIFVPIILAGMLTLVLKNTKWGYEVRVIGGSRGVAEFAGIPVLRHILLVMLFSGALAGLAGMVEVSATAHRLSGTISNNYGYMGIIVAALANGSPFGVLIAAFSLAVLLNAGIVLQTSGLSVSAMLAINGVILIFAAVGEVAAQYQLTRRVVASSSVLAKPGSGDEAEPVLVSSQEMEPIPPSEKVP